MAAAVEVRVFHGGNPSLGENVTGKTARFKLDDNDAADALTPVEVPSAGVAHSWRKSFKLIATSSPDNGLANLRFFSDGSSLGTGRRVLFARSTTYVQASASDQGTPVSAVDVDTKTANSPEVIQAGEFISSADTLPFDGGALQDHVMLQLEVSSTALAGAGGAKTLTYRYDET